MASLPEPLPVTREEQALCLEGDALATVVAWQRSAGSHEVCGLCAVDERGALRVLPLTNHAGLAGHFEVSGSEEEVVRAAAAQRGWDIVAFLHTHPHHAPEMSPRDASCFERDTLPWIIVGTPGGSPSARLRPTGRPSRRVLRGRRDEKGRLFLAWFWTSCIAPFHTDTKFRFNLIDETRRSG